MKTDAQLKADVIAELEWDPSIQATRVGVAVKNGVVTLTGHLDTYAEKHAIERATLQVQGVKAVAVEIDVKLDPSHQRSDTDLAAAIESAFDWHSLVPADRIQVKVEKGWVTLQGEVDWDYQRRHAEKAVRPLIGVVGISNAITLKPSSMPGDVAGRIREALTRRADREARQIEVKADDAVVTLRGIVNSWAERSAAYEAAWSAPGVMSVVSEIQVQP